MTKIVQLTAENVKRLTAVQIRPDGNLVVIGGKNGAGKSSVLDSIAYALGGKGAAPAEPIRRGEEAARVVLELDDIIVRRTITGADSYLTVETKEGARYPSPQAILDRLTGELTFDPLSFVRLAPAAQAEALRQLVGIDFADIDKRREAAYMARRDANRAVKALSARFDAAPYHEDGPEEPVSVAMLTDQLEAARDHNEHHLRYNQLRAEETRLVAALEKVRAEIAREVEDGAAEPADEGTIRAQIHSAETLNQKYRENAARWTLRDEVLAAERGAEIASTALVALENERREAIAAAAFPIDGLGFDGDVVTYHGIPFDQASQAEQIRVSVAVGLAMNPELRVLLVRDGSLLDENNLQMIAEMAAGADAQVWLERVSEGDEVSVIIEDGMVKGASREEAVSA